MKKFVIAILSFTAAVSAYGQQARTVTNNDLEKFRQQRIENERKLKERYAEMGFPSPEEIERQNRERREKMEQYSDELRERRLESQGDIVAEANELRMEIASIDAQINYLRNQGGGKTYKGGTATITGYLPYGGFGGYGGYGGYNRSGGFRRNRSPLRQISRLPRNMRTVQEYGEMYPSSRSIYNQSIGNVRIGGGRVRGGNGYYGGYVAPVFGGTYDASTAADQLIYLEQTRAGLLAQWQIIEEKARRAGIRLN